MEDVEGTLRIDMSPEDTRFDGMDSTTDHSNDKLTLELANHEETSVTTFIDQHTVQLEDGSTAYIYQRLNGDMNDQYIDTIELGNTSILGRQPTSASALTQTIETKAQNVKCEKDGCVKVCPTSRRFRAHKRSRAGEKPYKCEWKDCGKSFSTNYALKSHLRVHTGEKPYGCNYRGCNKAFKTAGDLQKHTRTHTGEKPFKCPFEGCPKAFTTSNILKVHIRTHTGERPYKCPFNECEKTFSTATNYNNHVRIHTGEKPFWCDIPGCGKRFTEYSSFYKHQVVHTDRNIYSCCHCGKYYTYSSTLLAHKKTAHNDDSRIIQNSERVRTGRRKRTASDEVTKLVNSANGQNTTVEDKLVSNNGEDSHVVLLPVETVDQQSTTVSNEQSPQVAAVVTADSGQQLAILSHNGSSQQFTLALTDHGSTILLPSTDSNESESSPKPDEQVVYISTTDNQRNLMSMIEKDNTLQRIEASETNTSTSDTTPINEDIWLHQPQKDDISSIISVKDEAPVKENDSINIHFESPQNPCEDASSADSIAYLEIGGAKYQLKIVSAENDTVVDQLCLSDQNENQPTTQGVITDTTNDTQSVADDIRFNELSFLNTPEEVSSDGVPSSPVQYSEERIDPEGSQRCEPFCKRKKLS